MGTGLGLQGSQASLLFYYVIIIITTIIINITVAVVGHCKMVFSLFIHLAGLCVTSARGWGARGTFTVIQALPSLLPPLPPHTFLSFVGAAQGKGWPRQHQQLL